MSKSDDIQVSIAELEAVLAKATDEYHRAVLEQAIDQRRALLKDLSGGQAPATLSAQTEFAGGQTP